MQQYLSLPEVAYLSGVSVRVIDRNLEGGAVPRERIEDPLRGGKEFTMLPVQAVAYFLVMETLRDLRMPMVHRAKLKEAIWASKGRELGTLELLPGLLLDLDRLAGERWPKALRYFQVREDHIFVDPELMGGAPCIRGPKITVYELDSMLATRSMDEVAEKFTDVPREALEVAAVFADIHPVKGRPTDGKPWVRVYP